MLKADFLRMVKVKQLGYLCSPLVPLATLPFVEEFVEGPGKGIATTPHLRSIIKEEILHLNAPHYFT